MVKLGKHAHSKQRKTASTQILRACPATSSACSECIFPMYDLACSEIRKSLDVEKAEKLVKIYIPIVQS